MKRFLLICLLFVLVVGCSNDDVNTNIAGKWKLFQILVDPGDGSGVFTNVDSDKTITFLSDSTFISNGNMCFMAVDIGNESSGTYSESQILINSCSNLEKAINRSYKLIHNTLEINYPFCVEPCAEKYIKIE